MFTNSLPATILSHMVAVNNVPLPLPRNIPNLKMSKNIDYNQLNALCHMRGLHHGSSTSSVLSVHNTFIKEYPKIFLRNKKIRLPKLSKQEENRKLSESRRKSSRPPPDVSHNIADHVKKAHAGLILYGQKKLTDPSVVLLNILKKLPIHRTPHEHKTVWKILKTIPDLACQLSDEHLKILSKRVISQTWVKGCTVVGNDGFYIILKGLARPKKKPFRSWSEDSDLKSPSTPHSRRHSYILNEEHSSFILTTLNLYSRDSMLKRWNTFGSLEMTTETQPFSVVIIDDCELLKIPAEEYAKLKLEKIKFENEQKSKLIRKCPYYEGWPTLAIYELTDIIKWKKFPPGHVVAESGNILSFVGYIHSGYCKIYRSVIALVKLKSNRAKKCQKLVYMGKLKAKESFGEISVLLQVPFTCTIIAGKDVEMAIIEDKDLFELDPVTIQLMIQTAQPTFGHLTDEDVKNVYLQEELKKDWEEFKGKTLKESLYYNGIKPGCGKWSHSWTSIPRKNTETLIEY
ncbi:cyclic nucleotide-binding domain-containing protein 1 [Otolemur garnettii]|uniref:cyclic nucleotide-binding domain-containing protein 1 n=1 Tax=Otolemur garnettii TaxID=30611 RepID=UPI000C7ECF9C|nr:cyclic nucleotide-binding domain-containing protein 1 [Otolemur garnettii]